MTATPVVAAVAAAAVTAVLLMSGPVSLAGRGPRVRRHPSGSWLDQVRRFRRAGPKPDYVELLRALAAELASGQATSLALEQAAAGMTPDPCPRARSAARTGGDVAAALRSDAAAGRAPVLAHLAACWEVASHTGAGLAHAVGRLADGARASEQARAELAAEVAAVRTSARLLAALPLFGLVIGYWIGADPISWLTGSWPGRATLALGLLLEAAGLIWLRRMVAAVQDVL